MKKTLVNIGTITATLIEFSSVAHAATCTTETAKDDLSDEQIVELYECIKGELQAGYASGDNEWAKAYPEWGAVFTVPGGIGNHGSRFLTAYVNDIGFDEYVKYNDEDAKMPVGTVVAKESFNVDKKGVVKKGPLFLMEKLADGEKDELGNWSYSMVNGKGKPMKVKEAFCHQCHGNFEGQDALGYPEEDYRITVSAD